MCKTWRVGDATFFGLDSFAIPRPSTSPRKPLGSREIYVVQLSHLKDELMDMIKFRARIEIIGVNPFVFLPESVLNEVFKQASKNKGKIPVRMKIDGQEFVQTLVKWKSAWRLYLNMPMRKAAQKDVGDIADFEVAYDPIKRVFPIHPKFEKALKENKQAKQIFDSLRPSLQLEINRYFGFLKTEESVDRNVNKAILFLLGKGRFVGRDKP